MRLALVCFYCLCVFVYVLYFIATMSFAGYFLPVLFCMLSMLISDSRFDLVWSRLCCDHGWIRSGSVNVRKQQQQQHTNKRTKDNMKFPTQHSSTDSPTIVYFKLAQLSHRKGHDYADSQAHPQAGSQASRCLGWQKRGVNEIDEASPSSLATKQNNFYPVLIVLFYSTMTPNKR